MTNSSPPAATARCGRPLSIDADARDVTARRNILLGLWAARRLGLPPARREAYAWSLHFADFEAPGDADVVAKVLRDLAGREDGVRERLVRNQLREMEFRAFLQLSVNQPGPRGGRAQKPVARERSPVARDRRRRRGDVEAPVGPGRHGARPLAGRRDPSPPERLANPP